ncbi:ABC transporter permease [Actinotalea sp. K2]|uniref:ABC transporter permease n=1 Tax=Actinotalea sp. K2 TaxID=2939438 RepID=UPI002016DC95|nr:ABC transporter permease [Actinotalea sp. K2]MCL3860962.1 ABC transporter permease [Actinotalea sp. K2]
MSSAGVVWMVARREIKTRMLTKANIISLSVMLAVIAIGTGVAAYFMNRDSEPPVTYLAVAESVTPLQGDLEAAAAEQDVTLELTTLTVEEAQTQLVGDGDLQLDAFLDGEPSAPRMLVASQPDMQLLALVTEAAQSWVLAEELGALGGDAAALEAAIAGAAPQVESVEEVDGDEGGGFYGPAYFVSLVVISLLLFALIGSGSLISVGVVEEKTSRVVEILLATIKPSQLLTGKILGIGVYGLFQVVLLGGAAGVSALVLDFGDVADLNIGIALVWLVIWFLIGYTIYALLFGGLAALVSRQEDIGSVTTPLMFLLFVPFYATLFLVPNTPDSTLVRVLSQVPFFSPFMMPTRDALGALAPWEMPLAISVSLLTIPALIWLAARIYQRGVLHTGGRMKLREALRS